MQSSEEFTKKLEEFKKPGDLSRILSKHKYRQETELENHHIEKKEYSDARNAAIRFQNLYWADVPLTVVSILSLFFVPLF